MKIFHDLNEKCHILTRIYTNFKGNKGGLISGLHFTSLESPAACPVRSSASIGACNEDEDEIPFGANTGFKAPCEPSRWKVEYLLTGFIEMRVQKDIQSSDSTSLLPSPLFQIGEQSPSLYLQISSKSLPYAHLASELG